MNNLKRVLALGLALVMLLGMFTIASAAKDEKMVASDLTDWTSVEHKDAVALMVDLGIINGIEGSDGKVSFQPTGNIDRASWAKMAYYAATGSDDVTGFKGADCGLKDISGNWAEGYIAFLAAAGYVSGDNEGNYNPSKEVTVAEACKIMLTILGYDANDRGYQNVGNNWSGNVMTDAKRNGLMNNVDRTQNALVPLTRENAAEIVYNALQANTVEAEPQWDAGNKYITKYVKGPYLGYEVFGVLKVNVKLDRVDSNGYGIFTGRMMINDTNTNLSAATLDGKVKASMDVAGEVVSLFIEATNAVFTSQTGEINLDKALSYKSTVSTTVARGASSADKVFTGGFKWADLTDASSDDYVAAAWPNADNNSPTGYPTQATYYINGAKVSEAQKAIDDIKKWTYNTDADADFRKLPGTVVEFYLDNEGVISTVKAYHYTVTQIDDDAVTRTSGGKLQVQVPGIFNWIDADRVTGYQGLVKDDVVLWYRDTTDNSTAKYVIEKAEMVTGKVSSTSSSKAIIVNGTSYKRTADEALAGTLTPDGKNSNQTDFSKWNADDRDIEFNFYLDKNGTVCFTEQVSDSVNKGNVALILAAEWTGTDMATASGLLEAKLLFIDGTTDIVTISKVDMDGNGLKQVVTTKSSVASTAARQIIGGPKTNAVKVQDSTDETHAIAQIANTKISGAAPAFFNYKVVDGKYELTKVIKGNSKNEDDWTETVSAKNVAIDKVADFTDGAIAYSANARTTFVVAKGEAEAKEFYTYTSYKNVPATKDAGLVMAVGTYAAPGAARYVYIDTESYTDDVPDGYKFIYTNGWKEDPNNDDCYLVDVVKEDGSMETISMTTSLWGEMAKDSNKFSAMNPASNKNTWVGKFVKVDTVDEKGVHSALDDTGIALGDIAVLGDEVVQVEGEKSYATDSMTKFVYVDLVMNDGDDTTTDADDTLEFSGCGTFKPDGWYKPATVSEPAPDANGHILMSTSSTTYRDIKMVVIPNADGKIADFVYVVRVLW